MIISMIAPLGMIMDIIISLQHCWSWIGEECHCQESNSGFCLQSPFGVQKKSFGAIPRAKPSGWPLRIFLSPSGMIKSRIPRLPHDNATLSFASTSAKRPPLGVVDHYGSRKGVHPFTGSLTTFNVTGCLVYLFGEAMIMCILRLWLVISM